MTLQPGAKVTDVCHHVCLICLLACLFLFVCIDNVGPQACKVSFLPLRCIPGHTQNPCYTGLFSFSFLVIVLILVLLEWYHSACNLNCAGICSNPSTSTSQVLGFWASAAWLVSVGDSPSPTPPHPTRVIGFLLFFQTCQVCQMLLPNQCSFCAHQRIHAHKSPYCCPECGVLCRSAYFQTHVKENCLHYARKVGYRWVLPSSLPWYCPMANPFSRLEFGYRTQYVFEGRCW